MSIQGKPLEVTVVSCSKLKNTEWISRQDPYVCVEYGNTKYRTRTCTDGGRNPVFQEKFVFPLIEGLRDLNVIVWNSNTLSFDDFIGTGKIQLHKVLSQGYDDSSWPLQSKTGRYAGELKLILHYAIAANHQLHNSSGHGHALSYGGGHTQTPSVPLYSAPSYPAPPSPYLQSHYPPSYPQPYPASSSPYPSSYSQHSSPYPPSPYPASSPYPPSSYPPSPYPPPPSAYPPPAPGMYPPPPY